jgi:hypothetical protein
MKRLAITAAFLALAAAAAEPAAAAWSPPRAVDGERSAWELTAAANAHGVAVLAWNADHPRRAAVRARIRAPGGALGAVTTFQRAGWRVGRPAVAINAAGTSAIVWMEYREERGRRSGRRIVAARRPARGRWSAPAVIGRSGKSNADPLVAINISGEAVAAWRYDVRFQAAFQAPRARAFAAPHFIGSGQQLALTYDRSGRAVAIWAAYPDARRLRIAVAPANRRRFDRPGTIAGTVPASEPAIAALPDGGLAVAYKAAPNNGTEFAWGPIAVTSRGRTGAFSTPRTLTRPDAVAGGRPVTYASGPSIAAGPRGELLVAWQQVRDGDVGTGEFIAAATAASRTAPFQTPTTLGAAGQFDTPSVAVDASGTAGVLWRQVADGRAWASVKPAGGTFGPAQAVSSGPVGYRPRLASGLLLACVQEGLRASISAWHGTS